MKSQQKFIFISLIIGLITVIIIMYISGQWKQENKVSPPSTKYKLLEVNTNPNNEDSRLYGQVNSSFEMEVRMNVSGKIDDDNHTLKAGTIFKKNDILIKVDRLNILYQLLATRSQFKSFLQETIKNFPNEMMDKKAKWQDFEDHIENIQLLPALPKINSKEEDAFITKIGLYNKYYQIKKLELEAENYIYAAPFDGIIVESSIHPGSIIKKNTPLLKISKLNSLIVKAHIRINSIHHYENAKQVYYVDSKLDTIGKGVFKSLGAELSDSSTIEGLFSLTPQNSKNLSKVVQIILSQKAAKNGVILPKSAVKNDIVLLYDSNKIFTKSIRIKSILDDSVLVTGLPNHCFVIIQP